MYIIFVSLLSYQISQNIAQNYSFLLQTEISNVTSKITVTFFKVINYYQFA